MNLNKEFKSIAQTNEIIFKKILGDYHEKLWNFINICNDIIGEYSNITHNDEKKFLLITMLQNLMADLTCSLETLERGHEHVVSINLRSTFEHLCLIAHIYEDDLAYKKFFNNKHDVMHSVSHGFKKINQFKDFGRLYGELSNRAHQSNPAYIARQVVMHQGNIITLLIKPINKNKFVFQAGSLINIIIFIQITTQLAEEICVDLIDRPCFLVLIEKEKKFLEDFYEWANNIINNKDVMPLTHS